MTVEVEMSITYMGWTITDGNAVIELLCVQILALEKVGLAEPQILQGKFS